MQRRRRCTAPGTVIALALLCAAALPLAAPHADGAGSCRVADVHGTRTKDTAFMHISLPSGGYDSDSNGGRVPVMLHCTSAACRNGVVNNGFLLSAYDADGNAVGSFVNWPAGVKRACGSAVTHAVPFVTSNWTFSWSPGDAVGPITFHAAVAVGHDISYLERACLHDVASSSGGMSEHQHMDMGRRRRALRRRLAATPEFGVPVSDVYQACPGRAMAAHAQPAGMGGPSWTAAAGTAGDMPLLFPGASLNSGGRFAGAVLATFAFAAASSAMGVWAATAQAQGAAPDAPRWRTAAGAAGGVLRHGGHYGCMLIAMSYSIWLLLALMFGHASAYAATALAARRRAAKRAQEEATSCG